jgi:hypothetical protein
VAGVGDQLVGGVDLAAPQLAVPRRLERREVERQVQFLAGAVVAGHLAGREEVHLAEQHPIALVVVDHLAQAPDDLVVLHGVVDVGVRRGGAGRVVGQAGLLAQALHDVDPEPVDAPVEPEPHDVVHGRHDLGVLPVEVGLLGQEQVEVPLLGGLVPRPRGAEGELGDPVVRRLVGGAVAPHVPIALGVVTAGLGRLEPRVLVGGVVGDEVDQQLHAAVVARAEQAVEVVERPEQGIDVAVVGDVVAEVGHRGPEEGREPECVDAEPRQVVEAFLDARQVTHTARPGRREGSRIDLVEDCCLPPGNVHRWGA